MLRNYYEELYARKFENLDEMDKFLEIYNLPKLNEEEAQSLNRPVTPDEIETVIKNLFRPQRTETKNKSQGKKLKTLKTM